MAEVIPYIPDQEMIDFHLRSHDPRILNRPQYQALLDRREMTVGAELSDEEILICMEEGLIKVWDEENQFDIMKQIQGDSLDLRLGHDFWIFRQHQVSQLVMGKHREQIVDKGLLEYCPRAEGEEFIFHNGSLVLAFTAEHIALSNVVKGRLGGRSAAARLGLMNHQSSDRFESSFSGPLLLEFSNQNKTDVAVEVHKGIASIDFRLLGRPSSRPRSTKTETQSYATNQSSPFGFWDDSWTPIRNAMMRRSCQAGGITQNG